MKSISEEAKLSKMYTNNNVRGTAITLSCLWLNQAGVQNRHIMAISGHRSEQSLLHFITKSLSVYVSVLEIPIVYADSVSKSLRQNFFSRERPLLARGKISIRVGFDAQFHRLYYKTIGSCF